ncbi:MULTISPECIES: TenA family transcriptional regulator [Dickeya]|uniref:TenA family transcriptional regulator n=1 Tax=Dickeya TaxID=204037 RepID=UPI000532BB96|nr:MULTISPECIES: iron-containing redox enzyme family protein [Dickeya]TYL42523.1 iron-containing redox enzyme family protein [Dickeya sp. ws52]
MSLPVDLKDLLETTTYAMNVAEHPYFSKLINGEISKQGFIDSQMQFAHLVQFFSRPMASMIANIPNAQRRMKIVENLWEEHGKGIPDKIHGRTILTLIDRLGGNAKDLEKTPISANIEIFNVALKGIATFEDYRLAAAVFSSIERIFVEISSLICQAIIKHDWLPEEKITHYALHKEIDIEHAEDFLAVVEEDWANNDEESKELIARGIRLGASLFMNVYTNFSREFNY